MINMTRVLLIGDTCIDEYRYGTVDRISPEAPVPVFKLSNVECKPGMGGNVQKNLEAFGLSVHTLFGSESRKTRLIDQRSKQHVLRIDNDIESVPIDITELKDDLKVDAIVISDYCKGYITYEFVESLRKKYKGPIFIDTKKRDLLRFDGCIVKVNEHEFSQRSSSCKDIIVTLGSNGAMLKSFKKDDEYFPPYPAEVVDVCGAGDTFISALVYRYLTSGNLNLAIDYANQASSIAVQHSGVYTLKPEDIKSIKI